MNRSPITEAEQAEANLFYQSLGRAIARWTSLEAYMENMFRSVTKMDAFTSKRVFNSARSFRARADMLSAALDSVTSRPRQIEALKAIITIANRYSTTRNALAHDPVNFINVQGSPHYRTLVVFPLDEIWGDPQSQAEPISRIQIDNAAVNFAYLAALIAAGFAASDPQLQAPERLILLASRFPKVAHESRLDPKDAAQLELGLSLSPYPD